MQKQHQHPARNTFTKEAAKGMKEGKTLLSKGAKEEMEMAILGSSELCLRGSTLVFRSGSPCILDDLRRVAANKVSFPDKLRAQLRITS